MHKYGIQNCGSVVLSCCSPAFCVPGATATDMVIIYLSSGLTSRDGSEQEKRATLSMVKEENRHLNNSVMILTYALMNGTICTTLKKLLLCGFSMLHTVNAYCQQVDRK